VVDYKVEYAEQGQTSQVLATGLTSLSYTASGLTPGVFYEFTVFARNAYDYSFASAVLTVQSVYFPDPPVLQNDVSVTSDTVVGLVWEKPFDGGIPDLEYDLSYD
jgi:hypothetical protein